MPELGTHTVSGLSTFWFRVPAFQFRDSRQFSFGTLGISDSGLEAFQFRDSRRFSFGTPSI